MRGAIYVRISIDDEGEGKAIGRHERVARALARERGVAVPEEYVFNRDNDITGSGEKERSDYNRLMQVVRAGQVRAVVTTEVERLQRGLREFADFVEACEAQKLLVIWEGGSANFVTGDGIDALEDRANDARKELRKIKRRVRRMHADLMERGKYVGQHRTFGYEWRDGDDRMLVVEEEAELIREAARRVLGGEAIASICRDWARRGVKTLKENVWVERSLTRLLVSGRISGRRDYHMAPDGSRLKIPRIITAGEWDAIISPEESDRLRAVLDGRSRRQGAIVRRNLLTGGIARCGICGCNLQPQRLSAQHGKRAQVLICRKGLGYEGCGQISVMMQPVDALVSAAVLAAIDDGALEQLLRQQGDGGQQLAEELASINERLRQLGRQWAAGDPFAAGAREELVARERRIRAALDERRRALHLEDLPADLVGCWPTLPLHKQRAVIAALVEAVLVHPKGQHGGPRFDPHRVSIRWRA